MQVSRVSRAKQSLFICYQLPSGEDELVAREALKHGNLDWWSEDFLFCLGLGNITSVGYTQHLPAMLLSCGSW